MSRKIYTKPFKIISAGNMSGAITPSTQMNCENLDKVSYIAEWTGTAPVGSLQVQVRDLNYLSTGEVQATGWVNLGATSAVSGNTGSVVIDVEIPAVTETRIIYNFTSGVGTLNVTVAGRGIGT